MVSRKLFLLSYPITFKRFLPAKASREIFRNPVITPDQSFLFMTMKGSGEQTKKSKINMKLQNLIHILIGIVCIGVFPNAQAVNPPPDGGYPGGNTAEGQTLCLVSPAADSIRQLVSFRSGATPLASSIRPLALGRSLPALQMKIRPLAPRPF
jgi:hypothetical protein